MPKATKKFGLATFYGVFGCQTYDASNLFQVCSSSKGSLLISPRSRHIATVNDGKAPTVFVNEKEEFQFQCLIKDPESDRVPKIVFKPSINDTKLQHSYAGPNKTERTLNSSWLRKMNPVNYENVTVQCFWVKKDDDGNESDKDQEEVCKVKIIVIGGFSSNCSMNGALSCRARDLWDQIKITKTPSLNLSEDTKPLEPVVKYSIFMNENQSWIFCNETDMTGSRVKAGTHAEMDTGKKFQHHLKPFLQHICSIINLKLRRKFMTWQ